MKFNRHLLALLIGLDIFLFLLWQSPRVMWSQKHFAAMTAWVNTTSLEAERALQREHKKDERKRQAVIAVAILLAGFIGWKIQQGRHQRTQVDERLVPVRTRWLKVDRFMSIAFLIFTLLLVELTTFLKSGAYYESLHKIPLGIDDAWPAIQIPHWTFWAYSVCLLASAATTFYRKPWWSISGILLLTPLVYLAGRPPWVAFTHASDIFGGTGPDANPVFFIIMSFILGCVVGFFVFSLLLLWLCVRLVAMHFRQPGSG